MFTHQSVLIEVPFEREDGTKATPEDLLRLRDTLKNSAVAWSEGRGRGSGHEGTGDYFFECALRGPEAEKLLHDLSVWAINVFGQVIDVSISNESFRVGFGVKPRDVTLPDVKTYPIDWPIDFDLAILTVIGPELQAAQSAFEIDHHKHVRSIRRNLYYRAEVRSSATNSGLSVVLHCLSRPGNSASAAASARLLSLFKPKMIFLAGIAAGRKGRVRIGDVVTPRVILDDSIKVATVKGLQGRPLLTGPPDATMQMVRNFRYDQNRWHKKLYAIAGPPAPPQSKEDWWASHVAAVPMRSEDGLFSANLLLRDPEILDSAATIHQQINVGEMEAGGFVEACQSDGSNTPWYIVRGVSDFGDAEKNDGFHTWASAAALTFLKDFIVDCVRVDLLR